MKKDKKYKYRLIATSTKFDLPDDFPYEISCSYQLHVGDSIVIESKSIPENRSIMIKVSRLCYLNSEDIMAAFFENFQKIFNIATAEADVNYIKTATGVYNRIDSDAAAKKIYDYLKKKRLLIAKSYTQNLNRIKTYFNL